MTQNLTLQMLGDLREDIGSLRAAAQATDRRLDDIKALIERNGSIAGAVSDRVTSLEHDRTRFRTVVAMVSAISSAIGAGTLALFKGWFPHIG